MYPKTQNWYHDNHYSILFYGRESKDASGTVIHAIEEIATMFVKI